MADTKISELDSLTPVADNDLVVVVDVSDTTMAASGTTKKALKTELKGDTGATGATGPAGTDGEDAFVYIAYASDDSGTDFTTTFNAALNYIAIKTTTTQIVSPQASDFTGLWKTIRVPLVQQEVLVQTETTHMYILHTPRTIVALVLQ